MLTVIYDVAENAPGSALAGIIVPYKMKLNFIIRYYSIKCINTPYSKPIFAVFSEEM